MTVSEFRATLAKDEPPPGASAPLMALWWDAKGEGCWDRAHGLVDELDTREGMAVHAYLHRREGREWNADYWYQRVGRQSHRPKTSDEWTALVEALLGQSG